MSGGVGHIRLFSANHELIEERKYHSMEGARNIVESLINHYKGNGRYIHVVPDLRITDEDMRDFDRTTGRTKATYSNIPIYDYSEKRNGHGK